MRKINKKGHIPDEKLIEQLDTIFKVNGINMPREALEFTLKLTNAFMEVLRKDGFCPECKRKLYEAAEKE